MGGLSADTAYGYRVGSDADGWSRAANFTTPKSADDDARFPARVAVVGDVGRAAHGGAAVLAALTKAIAAGAADAAARLAFTYMAIDRRTLLVSTVTHRSEAER